MNDIQSDDGSSMSETVLVVENSSKNESFSGESDEDTLGLRSDGEAFSDVETLEENESEVSEIAETEGEVAFAEMERTSDTTSNVLPEQAHGQPQAGDQPEPAQGQPQPEEQPEQAQEQTQPEAQPEHQQGRLKRLFRRLFSFLSL